MIGYHRVDPPRVHLILLLYLWRTSAVDEALHQRAGCSQGELVDRRVETALDRTGVLRLLPHHDTSFGVTAGMVETCTTCIHSR